MTTQAYIKATGLEEYIEAIQKAGRDIDAAAQRALALGAPILLDDMQNRVPIDEGNLLQHIQIDGPHQEGNFSYVEVGVIHSAGFTDAYTARYGNAQEYGWHSGGKFHPGKPYIRPAIDSKRAIVLRKYRESLKAEGLAD